MSTVTLGGLGDDSAAADARERIFSRVAPLRISDADEFKRNGRGVDPRWKKRA